MDKKTLKIFFLSAITGLAAGLLANFYRFLVHSVEGVLSKEIILSESKPIFFAIFLAQAAIFSIICSYLASKESLAGGSGIPQVKAELDKKIDPNPLSVLFVKIFGGACAIFSGLSVGREGPSIQMGAMTAKVLSRKMTDDGEIKDILLQVGAASGLSAAFGAPVAGVAFILEELEGKLDKKLLIAGFSGTLSAAVSSTLFFGTEPIFSFGKIVSPSIDKFPIFILFGVFLSAVGLIYLKLMDKIFSLQQSIKLPPLLKFFPTFLLSAALFCFSPMLLCGGGFLLDFTTKNDLSVLILFLLLTGKLLFSLVSFTSGVAGGIFFPILMMGAICGMIFSKIFAPNDLTLFIIMGMAGLLTAIVRAPITGILLLFEMTGAFSTLLPLGIISLITLIIPELLNAMPVYDYLTKRLLSKTPTKN